MSNNVQVAVRIRPLSTREQLSGAVECVQLLVANQVAAGADRSWTFDACYGPDARQEDLFELTVPLLTSFLSGYNATILAYGQTGSGKTFTMGTGLDELGEECAGLLPRSIRHLFAQLDGSTDEILCSYLEIYNEELHDLLNAQSSVLTIRENGQGQIWVAGLTEEPVKSYDQVMK